MKYKGLIIDPLVLNNESFRVFYEDDSIGEYIEPLIIEGKENE